MTANPAALAGPDPTPAPRAVRAYSFDELKAIEAELSEALGPIASFAAATGLRPTEWASLERRDINRGRRILTVRGTKTQGSRREVPLTGRALAALDRLSPRLDTTLLFPSPRGGRLNLDHLRRREWIPAVDAAGIAKPARIYDLRSMFASNALAARGTTFELAKIMGTSVRMLEHTAAR